MCFLWPPCIADADIIFLPCGFFFLSFFISSPNLSGRRVDVYHTCTHGVCSLSANLECRSEMCCTRLAGNTGCKNDAKIAICTPSHNFAGLYLCNWGIYQQSEKDLLSSNISSTCLHNMVTFSPLAAEIISLVWGARSNFNGFRVLASLLHGTLVLSAKLCGVEQRAPSIFGRAAITLGIGSHSSWCNVDCFVCLLQLMLHNPICAIAFTVASWIFFKERIMEEEITLLNFFGEDYLLYQKRVPTGLPFIYGYQGILLDRT